MKQTIVFTLLVTMLPGCTQQPNCGLSEKYQNQYGHYHRELSAYDEKDSLYISHIEFVRAFVRDTLEEDPGCFQYNLNVDVLHDEVYEVIELYDKRLKIAEKSPFNDSIYYRLNQVRKLYFDSDGIYQYNLWVADTDEELEETARMLDKYFGSQEATE